MSHAKDPETRQRRNMPAVLGASHAAAGIPAAPSELSSQLRQAWHGVWSSPVTQLLDPVSDLPVVNRLFSLYELGERVDKLLALVDPEGESLADFNSLLTSKLKVAAEVRLIEASLGLSPRSRLALGLALLAGRKATSLDDAIDDDD